MHDFFNRLIRTIFFLTATFVGLILAVTFVASAAIALAIIYLIAKIRGKNFSAKQFWQSSRQRAQQTSQQFSSRFKPEQKGYNKPKDSEVTDVEIREIK